MSRFHTVGHSNRTAHEFLALLRTFRITTLVDVRRFPASRRHPQFNAGSLAASLQEAGVEYVHEEALGGMRQPRANSTNTGWAEEAFRGYADYLGTQPFCEAVVRLEQYAGLGPIALMCAEAQPFQCHRQLIADVLLVRGHEVVHILGGGKTGPHVLTAFAQVDDAGMLKYPPLQGELEFGGIL